MKKQLDLNMDKMIAKFFESVWAYVDKNSSGYVNPSAKQQVMVQKKQLAALQQCITKLPQMQNNSLRQQYIKTIYANFGFCGFPKIFMKQNAKFNNGSAAFQRVCWSIFEYYKGVVPQEKVLANLKNWYYVSSNNVFKGLYYPLIPLSRFAEKTK